MKNLWRWGSSVACLIACAAACGGSKSDADDDGQAGESGASGSGGSGAAGGATGGAGGSAGKASGAGGSTGGSSTGGSGGSSGGTGGSAGMPENGGASGAGGTTGGTGGTKGGSAGSGGSSGTTSMPPPGFTEGAILAKGISVGEDPKLAVNRAGVALVAWPGSDATHRALWTIRYDPATEAWGEPVALRTDEDFAAEVHDLALDEAGNAYVAWKQGYIFVTRYEAATDTWADAVQIEEHDTSSVGNPRVAAGPDGTASIVWTESDGSRTSLRNRRYDPTEDEWSYWEAIDERDYNGSSLGGFTLDSNGNALAAWQQSGESGVDGGLLVANRFDAESGTWGTVEVLVPQTGEKSHFSMLIKADPNDNFFLVWNQVSTETGGDTEVWARRYTADGWQDAVKLEDQDAFATTEPDLALDDHGNAIVVWTADDHLWGTRYDADDDAWSDPTKIDDTAGWVAKWSSVAMDSTGNALAVSSQWPAQDINLYIDAVASRYDAETGTWGPGGLLEHHDYDAFAPVVGMDGAGKGFVVWWQETRAELWVSVYEPD